MTCSSEAIQGTMFRTENRLSDISFLYSRQRPLRKMIDISDMIDCGSIPQFNTRLQTSPFQHSNGSLSDPARTDCIIPFAATVPAPARPPFAISAQRPLTDTPPFTHTFGGHPSERVVSPVVEALVRSEGHGDISGRITMEELDWHSGGRAQESAGAGT